MKAERQSRVRQTAFLALVTGAMAFALWLFEPLGLTSQKWNFVDMPSIFMIVVIFFATGLVPATGMTFLLPRLRLHFRPDKEGGVSLLLGYLPRPGRRAASGPDLPASVREGRLPPGRSRC